MSATSAYLLTLSQAADMLFYGACCEACRETRRIDLAAGRSRGRI